MSTTRCERVRGWRGRLELLGEHVARLLHESDAASAPDSHAAVEAQAQQLFDACGRPDGILELRRQDDQPPEVLDLRPYDFRSDQLAGGLVVQVAGERAPLPATKSLDRLEEARERLAAARAHGVDELLWSSHDGALLGATTMNLFLVRSGELLTPSHASGAWNGLLRKAVLHAALELAPTLGFTLRETTLRLADLAEADDAFLAGSAHGIVPIRAIDGRPLLAPPRGSPARKLVPQLKLRVHELCSQRFLPA